MDIWQILQIEPTRDKNALKKAYRKILVTVHPEDDPEGFRKLREAYEEALRLAECPEEPAPEEPAPDTPRGKMIKAMQEIYASFFRRVRTEEWETLLSEPYAVSLETSEEAMLTMLDFLMEHYNLPHQVYALIDRHYDLSERLEELRQRYPIRFLDYILANAHFPDAIDYTRFTGPEDYDYDGLIEKATAFSRALRSGRREEQEKLLASLSDLPVRNPEIDTLIARFHWEKGDREKALAEMERLEREASDDGAVLIALGDMLLNSGRVDEADERYRKVKAWNPEDRLIKGRMGEVCIARGEYEEARDIFYQLLRDDPYDNYLRSATLKACEGVAGQKEIQLKQDPSDGKVRVELAAAYYQCYLFEKAENLLKEIRPPEGIPGVNYHNYMGRSLLSRKKYDLAEEEIRLWIRGILQIPETDVSEDAVAARKRMGYARTLLAVCCMQQHRFDEARKELSAALACHHEEYVITLEEQCLLEYMSGNYRDGVRACVELERVSLRNFQAANIRAMCLHRLEQDGEAVEFAERAISIFPYVNDPYLTLADIMMKAGDYREAEQLADRMESLNGGSDVPALIRAKVAVAEKEDWKKALAFLLEIREHVEEEKTDLSEPEDYFKLLGDVYKKLEKPQEALQAYDRAVTENPYDPDALERLGDMQRRLLKYQEALGSFSKQVELGRTDRVLLNQGYCLRQLGCIRDARDKIMEAVEQRLDGVNTLMIAARLLLSLYLPEEASQALSCIREGELGENLTTGLELRLQALVLMKQYEEAEKVFHAVRGTHHYEELQVLHVRMLIAEGRFDEAEKLVENLNWRPGSARDKYDLLAEIAYYSEDLTGLANVVKRAEKHEISHPGEKATTGYQCELLGRLQLYQKSYSSAEDTFHKASDRDPGMRYRYLGFMAEASARQFNGKTRMQRYITVLQQLPGSGLSYWEARLRLAQGYRARKEYDRAEELLQEILLALPWEGYMHPLITDVYEEQGLLLLARKDKQRALMALEKAQAARGYDAVLSERLRKLKKDTRG